LGAAQELLQEATAQTADRAIEVQSQVVFGNPARLIVEHASEVKADLIVMGNRGLSDLRGLLMGSVSHQVAQLAQCGVLLIK
jgi:nucleotide-binding universal stress UspA family protein